MRGFESDLRLEISCARERTEQIHRFCGLTIDPPSIQLQQVVEQKWDQVLEQILDQRIED